MKKSNFSNKNCVHHFYEQFMKKGDLSTYDEIIAADAIGHCPKSWQVLHAIHVYGRKNTKKIDEEYRDALKFTHVKLDDLLVMDDKIFVRWESQGLHRGDFYGYQPTHRTFSVEGQTLFRFNQYGQILEVWQAWDMLGLLHQIGWQASTIQPVNSMNFNQLKTKASFLSSREKHCLKLFVSGKTAKESAAILFISHRTVEYYFENIKNKLDVSSKKELFALARMLESYRLL